MARYVCAGPKCSGCPLCTPELAALMKASAAGWAAWLDAKTCSDGSMKGNPICEGRVMTMKTTMCQCEKCVAARTGAVPDVVPPPPSLRDAVLAMRGQKAMRAGAGTRPALEIVWPAATDRDEVHPAPRLVAARR